MFFAFFLALIAPADLVPARWPWTTPKSLDLLKGTPVNCLLIEWKPERENVAQFAAGAAGRSVTTLAVIRPGTDPAGSAVRALRAGLNGVVLEGDFPEGIAESVRDSLADRCALVIELTARKHMKLGSGAPVHPPAHAPILGTYQGVWPGIQVTEGGAAKAGPSGSPWIDTNSGFLRAARAWGDATIWLGNLPPANTVVTDERYLQVISDAAIVGARWIVALDDNLARRLEQNDGAALKTWKQIAHQLKFYEEHREWRDLKPAGKLALVQDAGSGALLSGGILDMIAARHTPVRPVPPQRLSPEVLSGVKMAVNVDSATLNAAQKEVLKNFTRAGGTLLTGPPGWKSPAPQNKDQITLEKEELERLDDIWHDVQSMIGRQNLGVRLFNVASMLSNLLTSADGKQVIIHLVNYSSYPIDAVAVHLLGDFKHARLYTPDGPERELELYKTDEGTGVDIDQVSVSAALRFE